jgi:hypothetical protein
MFFVSVDSKEVKNPSKPFRMNTYGELSEVLFLKELGRQRQDKPAATCSGGTFSGAADFGPLPPSATIQNREKKRVAGGATCK